MDLNHARLPIPPRGQSAHLILYLQPEELNSDKLHSVLVDSQMQDCDYSVIYKHVNHLAYSVEKKHDEVVKMSTVHPFY